MYRKLYRTIRNLLSNRKNLLLLILVMFLLYHLVPKQRKTRRELLWDDKLEKHVTVPDTLMIIVREFEDFDNRLHKTIHSAQGTGLPSLLIADDIPYPPVKLPVDTTLLTINTSPALAAWRYQDYIKTTHVAIIPDGCYVSQADSVIYMIARLHEQNEDVRVIAAPCETNVTKQLDTAHRCQGLNVDLRKWTLTYYDSNDFCDSLSGPHILVMATKDILSFPYPFARPVQDAIFIQSALRKWKVMIFNEDDFVLDSTLYKDPHKHWKHKFKNTERVKELYKKFGIKLVHNADGKEEYYGCTRDSARCFGTVHNDMAQFLYQNRWTPPCCLKALRTTGKYVFELLKSQGVRYWLEGGSLLGAARNGDIIPWDYDIDVGIYREDIEKSVHLTQCTKKGSFIDDDGFVWEKSKKEEGDFFRVQFSETNHLHVDIFPFYPKNGLMTKDTWFKTHKQDTEFAEHYLQPMSTIDFIGMQVSVPNNWKQFLEFKFGKDVIENPKYPDTSMDVV